MNILKYFRKHSRIMLLLFMVVLMVVFVIGDAIGRRVRSEGQNDVVLGRVYGQDVHRSDVVVVGNDMTLARLVGLNTPAALAASDPESELGTYLLVREAEHMGVTVSEEQVRQYLTQLNVDEQTLNRTRERYGRSLSDTYRGLGRLIAALTLMQGQFEAAIGDSRPQLERAFREQMQTAKVRISVIDGHGFLPSAAKPDAAAIQTQFDECRDRFPAHTDKEMVFGYRQPDRVKLEYLTVNPEAITAQVTISAKETRRFYDENPSRYRTNAGGDPLAIGGQGAQTIQQTYEEAIEQVRKDWRSIKAVEESQKFVNSLWTEAHRPWDRTDGQAPPESEIVDFASLRERYADEFPITRGSFDWLDRDGVAALPSFGRAFCVIEKQRFSTVDLAFNVMGIAEPVEGDPKPFLHLNQPGPVVLNTRFNARGVNGPYQAYLWRVTAVAPSAPPASVDDVRDQVVEDLELMDAYKLAGAAADKVASRAREIGLDAAIAEATDLKSLLVDADDASKAANQADRSKKATHYADALNPSEPSRFTRSATQVPYVGISPALHERVFEMAKEAPDANGRRVAVIPMAKDAKWVVVELIEVKPVYQGDFDDTRQLIEQQQFQVQLVGFQQRWLNIDNIRKRTGYVDLFGAGHKSDDDAESEDESAAG